MNSPPYHGNLAVTTNKGVSISSLSAEAHELIDRLAKQCDVGRSRIAKEVIERMAIEQPRLVESIVAEINATPRRKLRRSNGVYARPRAIRVAVESPLIPRAQDGICVELNGCMPAGGCRYPNCECKS